MVFLYVVFQKKFCQMNVILIFCGTKYFVVNEKSLNA